MAKKSFDRAVQKQRIVLFGGSFNPPHEGHLHIAQKAYEALGCDGVWMMVAPRNPYKDPSIYADLSHRKKMSELMTAHLPWLKVTDIEQSYLDEGQDFIETAETLKRLRADYPNHEFVWMMGSDNITTFHDWGGWEDMVANHLIMVMNRTQSAQEITAVKNAKAIQASQLRLTTHDDDVSFKDDRGFYLVQSPVVELSSTVIRANLAQKQPDIMGLNADVAKLIADEGLYNYGGSAAPKRSAKQPSPKQKP
jgi:nicotinate-nucleotide adenylyltransferase